MAEKVLTGVSRLHSAWTWETGTRLQDEGYDYALILKDGAVYITKYQQKAGTWWENGQFFKVTDLEELHRVVRRFLKKKATFAELREAIESL